MQEKADVQLKSSQSGRVLCYSGEGQLFCSVQAFNSLDKAHPHAGQSALPSLSVYLSVYLFIYLYIYLLICLFLAALGLRCCMQAFSSCGEWGLLFVVVRGLLIVVASLVVAHGL